MVYIKGFFTFISSRSDQILNLAVEHIELTLYAVLFSILIGVPIGILITRVKKLSSPILALASIIQAVPSLALLGFMIPILGIGSTPAIVMVFLYSLLPIIKNTYTGLMNINPDTLEAARGMGLTKGQILRMIQFPLAMPVIMTGIRISAVTAVGLMTIAAFIGAGGLGYMVFSGVQTVNNYMILAGAIPACILALLMDLIIGKIELLVTPKGIKTADGKIKVGKREKSPFQKSLAIKVAPAIFVLVLISTVANALTKDTTTTISVGSKNFNEQHILAHMVSTLIEENTDIKVERKINLGGSSVVLNAMKAGELDISIEYTGTAFVNIMGKEAISDSDETYRQAKEYFESNYELTWLKPLGFNNTYTLAVTKELADKYNLKTFSDLAKIAPEIILTCTIEFSTREDGLVGLQNLYNMNFGQVSTVDGGLRYTSINSGQGDVIDAFSTDGLLKAFNLQVLEDDLKLFPPYHAAPVVRMDTLEKYPEIADELNKLSGLINDETMRELNYKVDKEEQDPRVVADTFLKEKDLID
ncbi:glycine betaine ABC transporter substrate-binding protein [Alloiococcus sp. CFN-8]|uniref:ABC transporter permease/substrate-binding protein n=1 Tax=Alloiococcus sp. CFN-8 TaxID=3416081 RepID=UPI003CE9ADDB